MKQLRWYEKNPDLKETFEFLEKLPEQAQTDIAQEIIQMLTREFKLDLDEVINKLHGNYSYKRWYDNNYDLFSAFEIIKNFSTNEQQKITDKIISTILLIYLDEVKNA